MALVGCVSRTDLARPPPGGPVGPKPSSCVAVLRSAIAELPRVSVID